MPTRSLPSFRPADLSRELLIGAVSISPDGANVAYTRREVRDGKDLTSIWVVPFAGGRPRRLTHHPGSDSQPTFSPDGRTLAFLSDRHESTNQLHVLPLDGGETMRLTEFKHGVVEVAWLPDGRRLAVLAHDDTSPIRAGERDQGEPTARMLRRVDWRLDTEGLLEHPVHVHLVPAVGGRTKRLTHGAWFASCLRVTPDGSAAAFLADRGPEADLEPDPQVHTVPVGGGPVRRRTSRPGPILRFAFDPDGTIVCIANTSVRAPSDDPMRVWHIPKRGEPEVLSEPERWTGEAEGECVRVTTVHRNGREVPVRFTDDGAVDLVAEDLDPVALALAAAGDHVAAVMTLGAGASPDVFALVPGRPPRRLASDGSRWLGRYRMPEQTEIDIKGPAGPIQCFVTAPAGRSRPRAAILDIHGGPTWAWGVQSTLDTLLLASAGYLVVRPNIRGSFNRGTQSVTDLLGDWGGVDAVDCHAVLDGLVRQKLADPDRLGCFGNSYGGFMVNWLVGTSQRFAAGVSSNGVTNQVSAFAGSDFGAYYNDAEGLGAPVDAEGVDSLWRQSPLRHVADIHTPLLMLQGENDLRCPPSDNEQLFVALRYLRRDVEYVLYPESAHEMSWTSRPDRRIDRAERILAWFKRYMAP